MGAGKTSLDTAVTGHVPEGGVAKKKVSSPAATGGAGTAFEQHVGAYWLAQLLVQGIPPILIDTTVREVIFQTERLGWNTDDFLVVCDRAGVDTCRLIGQVKRSFTVSAVDDECVKAIGDFWKDFKSADFSNVNDRLLLVTLRGTNTLLGDFSSLLDCARASRDGAEFEERLATEGLISKKATHYCEELKKIIQALGAENITTAGIWPFLRALHVLALDLHNSTRQTEAGIRSLLALTVNEGDANAVAAASWGELVGVASTGMSDSLSLCRADLPKSLQDRHRPIATGERRVLQALKDHTAPILRGIRSSIGGDLHLPRTQLIQSVLDSFGAKRVVIVAGPAGSGKSAIGKDIANTLARDHFVFGFRVEEFAQPHFDATLAAAQVPAGHATLSAVLAAQERKVILIESVERLLEKTTRDAFSDFMTLVADDSSTRVILTCRDYSLELVQAGLLYGVEHTVVRIPPLDDGELAAVEVAYPALATPLASTSLRSILRNPFILDKALGIQWSSSDDLPKNEREFRTIFWRDIVRAGHRFPDGAGKKREQVLEEIAVRRARALSPYVPAGDLDSATLASLSKDSLVVPADGNSSLVATGHDVLEDWAILQWLNDQHLAEVSFGELSATIGEHPAIRRSYRKWVSELVDRNVEAADRLFQAAVSGEGVSGQFRDDTLVSLLKAKAAPEFIERHSEQLLANERALLKRIIHLLRVACVKSPDWLPSSVSIYSVPDGSAWAAILGIVHHNLSAFVPEDRALLIGLIEDAVKGVSWWAPDVEGAEHIAGIAYWLLEGMRGYGNEDPVKRILKVIAKIPNADASSFEVVLRGHIEEGERRDRISEKLQDIIYNDMDGMAAARDLPDLIISVGEQYLFATQEEVDTNRRHGRSSLDIDLYFGISEGLMRDSFPASAMRGPWMHLLRHHPMRALDFYVRVFNHSTDWYTKPRLPQPLESPFEIELKFSDGTCKKQWANGRFWGLYRGLTVGPYILQSMLMALEKWLLDVAEQIPDKIDSILLSILRRSDGAMLTAVVASVATAYPHICGQALLVILSARDCLVMDRHRMAAEKAPMMFADMFPTFRADHKFYEEERKKTSELPHRQNDLEVAILNLQFGRLAKSVQDLIDKHLAELPPKDQQDEGDRIWRLALHRMDLRQLTISETSAPATLEKKEEGEETNQKYIRLDPKPVDADMQAMVDENTARLAVFNARIGIKLWGLYAFNREKNKYDPAQWTVKLAEAREIDRDHDEGDGTRNGPGFVAAVCIRDHWENMSTDQKNWCVDVVCSEVVREADDTDLMARIQRNSMSADRPSAFVLAPLLYKEDLTAEQKQRVREAFSAAMTHRSDEVRQYVIHSIDERIWAGDPSFALLCVNAIATEENLLSKAQKVEDSRDYSMRRDWREVSAEVASEVRRCFWVKEGIANDAYLTMNLEESFRGDALRNILTILGRVPADTRAIGVYARAVSTLVGLWETRRDPHDMRRERDFHAETSIAERIQEFLMRTTPEAAKQILQPVLDAVDTSPREVHSIIQGFTTSEDRQPNTAHYWFLWGLFAERIKNAKWLSHLDTDRPYYGEILSAIFLTAYWKDGVRHWRSLEGYAYHVDELFQVLPATWIVLDSYMRFLYHVGERSLPGAFIKIAAALRQGNAQKMLAVSNTVFMLETLLRRYVYGRPLELSKRLFGTQYCIFWTAWLKVDHQLRSVCEMTL